MADQGRVAADLHEAGIVAEVDAKSLKMKGATRRGSIMREMSHLGLEQGSLSEDKPLGFIVCMNAQPCLVWFASLAVVLLSLCVFVAVPHGMENFPDLRQLPDNDRSDPATLNHMAVAALAQSKLTGIGKPPPNLDEFTSTTLTPPWTNFFGVTLVMYVGREDKKTGVRANLLTEKNLKLINTIETGVVKKHSTTKVKYGGEERTRTLKDFCLRIHLPNEPCFSCREQSNCVPITSVNTVMFPETEKTFTINRTGLNAAFQPRFGLNPYISCLPTHSHVTGVVNGTPTVAPIPSGAGGAAVYNDLSFCYSLNGNIDNCQSFEVNSVNGVPSSASAMYNYAGAETSTLSQCTVNNGEGELVSDVEARLQSFFEDKGQGAGFELKKTKLGMFTKGFEYSNLKSCAAKVSFLHGSPFLGVDQKSDEQLSDAQTAEQEEIYSTVAFETVVPYLSGWSDDTCRNRPADCLYPEWPGDFQVIFFDLSIFFSQVQSIILQDVALAGGSMLFVYCYMWFHLKSAILASSGMLHIIGSFVPAFVIYRFVLGIRFFGMMNMLAVYIILAIGADDCFVFMDSWRNSFKEKTMDGKPLAVRMTWVWKKAAMAMFVTSFTTFASFMSCAMAPLIGIYSFGIFVAVLVVVNYIFCITWFPAILLIWYKRIDAVYPDSCELFCCLCCGPAKFQAPICGCCKECCCATPSKEPLPPKVAPATNAEEELRDGVLEQFFEVTYFGFLKHKIGGTCCQGSHVLIVLFLAIGIGMTTSMVVGLKLDKGAPKFFPDDHPLQMYVTFTEGEGSLFPASSDTRMVSVKYVFGLADPPVDILQTDVYNSSDVGTVKYNKEFDITSEASQLHYIDTCNLARASEGYDPPITRQDSLEIQADECACLVNDALAFYNGASGTASFIPPAEFSATVLAFLSTGKGSRNGRAGMIGFNYTGDHVNNPKPYFIMMTCNTSLVGGPALPTEVTKHQKESTKFIDLQNNKHAGNGMDTAVHESVAWVENRQKIIYMRNAVTGTVLGLGLAFVVLFFTSANIILSLLATLDIMLVVLSILGTMPLLGIMINQESATFLGVLVGLSVDYVVHLALAFQEAPFASRGRRVRVALAEMGVSVLSGALTSMGASALLFLCTIQFFATFGKFMFMTITWSILWGLFFFIPLLMVMGPQGNIGSFLPLVRAWGHHVYTDADITRDTAADEAGF